MAKFNLSDAEYEIMEFLWKQNEPVTLQEIIRYCSEERGRAWKQQTIHTFLLRLKEKEAVTVEKRGQKCFYSAASTIKGYYKKKTRQLLAECFDGSLNSFLSAFSGGESLSEDEKKILKEFIDE